MNIGIVCYPTFGGSGVVATELGKALASKGHNIHFISYNQPVRLDAFTENIFYHEVSFNNYPLFKFAPYETALTSKIVHIVKAHKIEVLHVHYAIPHAAAAVTAKHILAREGIILKIVTTLHGTDITLVGKDKSYEPVVSYSLHESDEVTAVSESLKKDTYEFFNYDEKITVVPNFIDFKRFNKQPKDHFKKVIAPNGEKILVHTSNFRKVKRVPDVLEIYRKVSVKVPAKLLLIGDGPERAAVEEECRECDICKDVIFLGKQEAVEEILSIADLFIIPSETESFGLAALEAMACEVPVISTNTGGLPEVNIDGVTGYTSNIGDVEKMAKDALEILQDKNLARFKAQAKEHSLKYKLENILPLYEALY
ncbi:MAG: N-acetyl-alpha-D-glucosaminyl L-malate synthase BshA [Bacteroidetes bacterium]|nr:MAG: N-acetyl-alpha-D-glucosaminyl L-malate synthase BshA [Bacteroidota bacterium]